MTNQQKTAIQQAEKQLEQERSERLRNEVYNYLKQELDSIDIIDAKIGKLSEEKRAHEENVKNIKQGNLKAIEERRKNYNWMVTVPYIPNPTWTIAATSTGTTSSDFYYTNVAGTTITTSNGKTYIF